MLLTLLWGDFLCFLFGHKWALFEQLEWEDGPDEYRTRTRRDRCIYCGEIWISVDLEDSMGFMSSYSLHFDSIGIAAITLNT